MISGAYIKAMNSLPGPEHTTETMGQQNLLFNGLFGNYICNMIRNRKNESYLTGPHLFDYPDNDAPGTHYPRRD